MSEPTKVKESAHTPEVDALIDNMLHGAGIPRCDEWDVLVECARTLEIERNHLRERVAELEKILARLSAHYEDRPEARARNGALIGVSDGTLATSLKNARIVLAKERP